MASWSDKTPTFNPYIQQLPSEEMIAVGTHKQQLYEAGLQKIQSGIDNVAGLDIMRDVGKNYLQQKLNELGQNLRLVAAGDFSNLQLVNSVNGLSGKIGKDPVVQNEVSSTMSARKELKLMDDHRKEGKGSPANEFKFNRQLSQWLNGTTPGESFNGRYSPFFDVDKLIRETFDSLKPDGYTLNEIFQTDENGNILKKKVVDPKTGKVSEIPIYSSVMSTLKKKGLFPEKVKETISQIFSDPRVANQLQIDGEYQYKDYGPSELSQRFTEAKSSRLLEIDDTINELNMKLKMDISSEEKDQINKQIETLNATKITSVQNYDELIKRSVSDPDAVRGALYKEEERGKYSTMYTNIEEDRDYTVSPYWQTAFEEMKFTEHNRQWWIDFNQKASQHAQNVALKLAELNKDKKEEPSRGLPTAEGELANPEVYVEKFANEGKYKAQVMKDSVDEFLFTSGALSDKVVKQYMRENAGLSESRARELVINLLAKSQKMSPADYRLQQYERASLLYNSNPSKRTKELADKQNSAANAVRNYNDFAIIQKKIFERVPTAIEFGVMPLPGGQFIATGTKDYERDIAPRLAQAIQEMYYKDPKLGISLITGEEKLDKRTEATIAGFVNRYGDAEQQESSNFNAEAAMGVVNGKTKGSMRLVAERDAMGQIVPTVKFIGEGGNTVSEMTITLDEAAALGEDVQSWWQDPEVRNANMRLQATNNKTTAYTGELENEQTYLRDDVLFLKQDFPLLKGMKEDVRANIRVGDVVSSGGMTSSQYYVYLYVNDGVRKPHISNLPIAKNSMQEAIQFLKGLTPDIINKIVSTQK